MDAVVITGGAGGLGLEIAHRLLGSARPLVLVDRDAGALARVRSELERVAPGHVGAIVADLSAPEGVEAVMSALADRDDVGALVNNAGGWSPGPQFPEATPRAWLSALHLNLLAPMLLTQRLWPVLAARKGAVVNIGSSGGVGDDAYGSPEYGAAKAGIRRLTSSLGDRDDVRVMAVIPGWIGLDRARTEWAALGAAEQFEVGPLIPPEEIADVVVELLERGTPGQIVERLRGDRS